MPLIWNHKVKHLLGQNKTLATKILNSNFQRYSKGDGVKLKLIDQCFKEQSEQGIIERIDNLDQYLEENPNHSFLAHMAVFKPERDTTKCRVVFLSNLCENNPLQGVTMSHNQAMLSGPCLNQKITTALLQLRFDSKLLCFDIKKAFLNICLSDLDSSKLLFLWHRNVQKGDYSIVAYRSLRLPFGLVCSPCILLLGLYKILMIDTDDDDQVNLLKRHIYSLIYMDNGSITANNSEKLKWAFQELKGIFEPYKFYLQQFVTNDTEIQEEIDNSSGEKTSRSVKLLGLLWDRVDDTLSTKPLVLDGEANTKRNVLKTIASHYDVFGFTLPILNRARLFLHKLQCDSSCTWDSKLPDAEIKEWKNICRQANSSPSLGIRRFVGQRNGEYKLIAFTDSSKDIYGTVIFIQDIQSLEVNFVLAKNRFVNKQLSGKSMPSLEFQAITLGAEVLIDTYKELTGPSCVEAINIKELHLFSDSLVSLSWINSHCYKLDKMHKHSTFIRNRLEHLITLCEMHPIRFQFVSGIENPADLVTRVASYKTTVKSNFLSGPGFLKESANFYSSRSDIMNIIVPNPRAKSGDVVSESYNQINFGSTEEECAEHLASTSGCSASFKSGQIITGAAGKGEPEHLVTVNKFSSLSRLVSVYRYVFKFIESLKCKLYSRYPERYGNLRVLDENLYARAMNYIIRIEQHIYFPEIFRYFDSGSTFVKDIPNIVNQLNVYPDNEGILRVKSKFSRWKNDKNYRFPVLLPKDSYITKLIVLDLHEKMYHSGCYKVLSELRRQFWIPHCFSVVKRILQECILCRKLKQRAIKLNQSPYRLFRQEPPSVPFRTIFIDHIGPYFVLYNGKKVKVWILCITCLWSRAINLKVCLDMTSGEFIRALQLHSFEYGVPELCLSDLGSSLVAGANIITDFLNDPETQNFFEEQGVRPLKFEQYFKGHHPLGGLVEVCVKMVRQLLHCSIKKNVLQYRDFEFVVSQTIHLVNRRPIAFSEGLRDTSDDVIPDPITPEKLIHGLDLISLNLIPAMQPLPTSNDPDWSLNTDPIDTIRTSYEKLKKVRTHLIETYNAEFLNNLMTQAVNDKSRYKPVTHKKLQVGDIVLIKEENCKPTNFPLAVVKDVKTNVLDEVTDAVLLKGKNREMVRRHVTSLIPILTRKEMSQSNIKTLKDHISVNITDPTANLGEDKPQKKERPKRKAALQSMQRTRGMISDI
ncbi:uncharacterized protein [Palaemon carinicauda]|uniref:uncharacterized protein n=1 Tax=Palaemon carinicauda TaxID=392227 RepID=UPI0035B63CCB